MKTMRLLVILVAAASLLGLRTGYACAYMAGVASTTCCCKDEAARCPMRHKCGEGSMSPESACCVSVVTIGAIAADQQSVTADQLPKLDLPATLPQASVATHFTSDNAASGVSRPSPATAGSLTWLRTSRLRL
jgi:hypothetical protein